MTFSLYYKITQLDSICQNASLNSKTKKCLIYQWLHQDNFICLLNRQRSFVVLFPRYLPAHLRQQRQQEECRSNCSKKKPARHYYIHLYLEFSQPFLDSSSLLPKRIRSFHYLQTDPNERPFIGIAHHFESIAEVGESSIDQAELDLINGIQYVANQIQQSITQLLTQNSSEKLADALRDYQYILLEPQQWPEILQQDQQNQKNHDILSSINLLHTITSNLGVINVLMAQDAKHQDPPSHSAVKVMVKQFKAAFSTETTILSK